VRADRNFDVSEGGRCGRHAEGNDEEIWSDEYLIRGTLSFSFRF
jgi:hypothetical protein